MDQNLKYILDFAAGKYSYAEFEALFNLHPEIWDRVQELLTNIGKHSDATFVRLNIIVSYPYILVKLADNSSGYNVESAMSKSDGKSHSGLRGVTERVKISQGEIKIKSETKKGVAIIMEFPIEGNTEANGE